MPKSDFEFCQICVELFVCEKPKNRLPAIIMTARSQKQSLRQPILFTLLKCF